MHEQIALRSDPFWLAQQLEESYAEFGRILVLLETSEHEKPCLHSGWSPKMVVGHVAYWDDYQLRRMQAALVGEWAERVPSHLVTNDERARHDKHRSWAEVTSAAERARRDLIHFARACTPAQIEAIYREAGEDRQILYQLLHHMSRHVAEHGAEIFRYCGSMERWGRAGLRRFISKQHENLLDGIGGLHEQVVTTEAISGSWTVRDLLAHVLAWEEYMVALMRGWPQPEPTSLERWLTGDTLEEANARLYAETKHLDMITLLDALATAHRRLISHYNRLPDSAFAQEGAYAWGTPGRLDELLFRMARHTAEHAAEIWEARIQGRLQDSIIE